MEYRRERRAGARKDDMPAIIGSDQDSEKLFTVLCNYLSLAQFELARSVLDELFLLSPEKVARVLRGLVLADIPASWLFSESVPSGAHLAWLALVEYTSLFERVQNRGTDEQAHRREWSALAKKMDKTPINPLGFLSHSRFGLEVLEATRLLLPPDFDKFERGLALGFQVQVECEGQEASTSLTEMTDHPDWSSSDSAFPFRALYADSKVRLKVYALRRHTPAYADYLGGEPASQQLVGVCSLPLHQLRQKELYHIWIPLEPPPPEDGKVSENPFRLGSARNAGLAQVAKSNFGKVRVRFRWTQGASNLAGRFSPRTVNALETDLLIANAIYNGRKAYYARIKGDMDAIPTYNGMDIELLRNRSNKKKKTAAGDDLDDDDLDDDDEDEDAAAASLPQRTPLYNGVLNDETIDGRQVSSNAPLLTESAVLRIREYCFWLLSDSNASEKRNPLVRLARDKHGLDEFLPADVLQQLRVVIRALPPAAHALCSRMANLARECELSREYHLHELESPSRFAALYASSIAEMLLNDEFAKASLTLHHLTHDIENRPVQSPLVDDVLTGVVSYVHDHHKQPDKPDRTLRSMLSKYAAEAGIKPGKPKPAGAHAAELSLFSNEQLIRRHQDVLLMQAQAYSALLGTDQEYSLRRFCALEDAYAHGSQHQRRKLPLCFVTLHTALDRLDRLPSLTPAERLGQQRLSLSAFFTEYYAYIRVTQQHVFQYAVKKALGFAKARNWKEANVVLRPLSQLRPLVVLIAWDEFDDDFHARQNLIVNLWRNRPSFPPDECSEPRLTQWCNRLDFNVRLINAVLAHFHPDATTSEENDKAIRLLDTLRLHSILYAFRDYLPALPPSVLLRLLDPKLQGLVLSADRGPECDHDLHVLRSYYAIRCVLGVMLGDLDDPAFEAVAAANADNEFALTDDDASRQGRQQRDASTDAGGSDSDEAKADEASDAESAAPSASAAQPKKVTPLDAARLYVLGMSKDEFQVTTLEKMFCLLFLLEDDLEERDADDSSSDEAHGGAQGFRRGQVVSDRARAAYESLKNDADLSLAESMDSTTRAFLQAPEHVESPMVVDTVQCQSLLFFMREVTLLVMKGMANPSHHNRNFMRLAALRQHIEEGIWRLSIIAESDDNPRIEDMVAPLEVISVKFLKLDLTAEAALPDAPLTLTPQQRNRLARLDNVFVAERWLQLCALVRDKTRSKKRGRRSKKASAEVVDAVIKFIRDFYQDPRAAVNTNPMQGFFFAMDVAITFSHVFTKKAYEQLMDYAIAFLQATKASHTTREAIELYNYYMAYAKHCRNNNRSKFRLAEAYEAIAASGAKDAPDLGSGIPSSQLAKRQKKKKRRGKKGGRRGDDSDDDLDDAAGATGAARRGADDDEPNALIHWVQAYRLTRRMRLGQLPPDESPVAPERKPPMPSLASALGQEDSAEAVQREREGTVHAAAAVRGGWLSAVTPADQDRIPSRPYVPYVERYEEYCEHMGIRSISDDLSDAAYRLIVDARLQHHAAEAGHGAYSDSDVSSEDSEGGGRRKTGGGPRADAVFDADDPERQSPWEGLAVIDYLSRVAHAAARTEAQLTPLPATATLHQRLVRVSERAALLGKKLLPSLGVIRYSMRHADEENIKALAERARTQSAFLPTYARWISSRTRMYEEMLDVLVRNEDGDLVLPDNIRDLLAFEDTYHDQKAHVVLLQMLLRQSSTLSLADKKKALALADRCINANPETQPEAESAVQQLLLSIIEDERHGDSVLRAHCVMRLKDTAWAAQMCAKYVDEWEDHDLAMSVLFKCLSDLKPAHPLRPRIAFKYNMILIFQHLTSACDAEQARAYLDRREADDPDMGRDEAVRVMKMFRTWRGFEAQCREHLAYVLITLLDMKQVEAAQDLFELYVKTRGSPHIGMELDPTMSDMVTDLIEAAAISRFLRPGCPMKERIEGVRRLRKLPEEKTFFIARALVGHLVDSRSRYLVLEYLNRFIEDQRATAALHPNSAPPEALSRITDEDMEWMNVMRVATQMLVNIPEDIERRVSRFYRSPKRIAMALLRLGHVQHMTRVLKFFKHYHGKELDHRDRIVDVRPGAPAPTTTASAAAPSSANGGAAAGSSGAAPDVVADESGAGALAATLDPARFNPSAYILEFAFEVLTLEHADMGKDTGFACFDMVFEEQKRQREDAASRRKKAARKSAKEPIEVRKTQEIADRVDEKVLVALVATTCINAVNALSAKLGHHEHALFVVHLMKTVLTYFKGKLEPRLEKEDLTEFNTWRSVRTMQTHQRVKPVMANLNRAIKAILKRYKQYRELVFTPQELAQIDGTDPAGVAGQDMPLLYSLRRVRFNLDDLCDPIRAQDLRHRLVDLDKIELARRVWVEAEKKDPDDFEREISSKVADVEEMCKKFAAQVGDA